MAENDILVPRENAAGGFDERVLTAADIAAAPATGIAPSAISGTAVVDNDARLTNSRTPTSHASTHHTGGSDPLTAANIGAAKAVGTIELNPNGTTTITASQLPARGIAYIEGGGSFTVNLPTPDKRQSGLTFSIKVEHEGASGDVFITVVHNASDLLTGYELDEDESSLDFLWDGYRWTYSSANWLYSYPNRRLVIPPLSGTLGLSEPADNVFRVVGSSDATKKVAFEVDGLTTATTRTLTVPNASGTIALTAQLTDTQIFTSNGTWTKPAGAKMIHYTVIGGGGGGGSGRIAAAGTDRGGGGGGSGGGITLGWIEQSALGATETITVGSGGAGGASNTASTDTNGNIGTVGGQSSIGTVVIAVGGNAGQGGVGSGTANGGAGTSQRSLIYGTESALGAGGSAPATSATSTAIRVFAAPTGGGGGGRITSGNLAGGGASGSPMGHSTLGQVAGAAGTPAGAGAGASGTTAYNFAGTGGAGASSTSVGFQGGSGGLYGGGGGGGSAAENGAGGDNSGGNGGAGIVVITTYF